MYVYWGTGNSGKRHIELYADMNNKTTLHGYAPNIYNKRRIENIHRNGLKWKESIYHHTIYHKQKKYDDLLAASHSQHILKVEFENLSQMSDINTKTTWSALSRMYDKEFLAFSDRRTYRLRNDMEEYSKREYMGSLIYFKLLMKNSEELCEPLSPKMLNDNFEEIFDGVDNIAEPTLPNFIQYNGEYPEKILKKLQSSVNIVPYKTDLLDSVINKLDSFSDSRGVPWGQSRYHETEHEIYDSVTKEHIPKGTLYETYKNNPLHVWRFLDGYQTNLNYIIALLRKNNIPYQMFDLDTHNYDDVYKGWDIVLPRTATHLGEAWAKDDEAKENYKEVEKMAKEYLSRREKNFQTSMKRRPYFRMV
tara:strand:+ start:139 stop:1227 length:1089 start_codon:yes stop_codon:yes gene_type:complete